MSISEFPLNAKTPVEVCIEILEKSHVATTQDAELHMAVCYFLAQNASPKDARVIAALRAKLNDRRAIHQHVNTNEHGMIGSDFYVDACAADALVLLGSTDVEAIHKNEYEDYLSDEAFCPRRLQMVGDRLVLSEERLFKTCDPASLLRPGSIRNRSF
jgi:hypothetical protein